MAGKKAQSPIPVVDVNREFAEMAKVAGGVVVPETDANPEGGRFVAGHIAGDDLVDINDPAAMQAMLDKAADEMTSAEGDVLVNRDPDAGDGYVKISYHIPTKRYCNYNPQHDGRSDFDIRRIKVDDVPRMNLVA